MAEISVTLKGNGKFEDPWIVIRGDDVEEVHGILAKAHEQDLFTATGRANAAYKTGIAAGSRLDATTVSVEPVEGAEEKAPAKKAPAKKAPAKKAAPKKAEPAAEEKAEPAKRPAPAWMKK